MFWISILMLLVSLAQCEILSRSAGFSQTAVSNYALKNHLLRSLHRVRSPTRCLGNCLSDPECVNVNYSEQGGICELNNGTLEEFPGDVMESSGWGIYEIGERINKTIAAPTTVASTPSPTTPTPTTAGTTTIQTTAFVTTEKQPLDCSDILSRAPSSISGVYTVYPGSQSESLQVYCDMDADGGGWTVFQRRVDDSQDFYLDWASYKAGFGDLGSNFWLGNDALHEMTTQRDYQIKIEMQSFQVSSTYAHYGLFRVDSEANKYRLTLGTFYGSSVAGDAFSYHDGQYFSTRDRDNDIGSTHCAQTYLGAWWFKSCISCCLNGPYRNSPTVPEVGQGVVWSTWPSLSVSKSRVEMKIRI